MNSDVELLNAICRAVRSTPVRVSRNGVMSRDKKQLKAAVLKVLKEFKGASK